MFMRNGQALGSVVVEEDASEEDAPKSKPKAAPVKKAEPAKSTGSTESKDSVKSTDK